MPKFILTIQVVDSNDKIWGVRKLPVEHTQVFYAINWLVDQFKKLEEENEKRNWDANVFDPRD